MTSWHLIVAIFFLLLGFGLLMVLSASSIASYHEHDGAPFATFENQALFAVIGMAGFLFASRLSTRVMRTFSFPLVAVSLLLLAAVLLIGKRTGGAKSWIVLGPIQFQPSEVAKLALLIWMAHVLASRRNTLRSVRSLLLPVLPIFLLMVGLIMLEPDLGTTVSLGIVFIAVLWFGGAPWWMFAGLTAGAAGLVLYLATSAGYRSARVAAWLHPNSVKDDSLYQIHQSMYGLGHGGIFGAGLGQAVSKTGWLPNADSDFIFAVIGEELGLIGAGLVLLLFGLLAYTGLRIARRNVDPFIKIAASAGTVWLVGQAGINIGYVVGLLPVTGIPLPMISRGGTSLVITMVVFGMLANFARREPQAAAALRSEGPGPLARFLGLGVKPPKVPKSRKPPKSRKSAPSRKAAQPTLPRKPAGAAGVARGSDNREAGRRYSPLVGGSPQLPRQMEGPARRSAGQQPLVDGRSRRNAGAPPRLRRSGDSLPADRQTTDWQGRSFVDPAAGLRDPRARRRDHDAGRGRDSRRRDGGDTGRARTVRP